MTQPPGPVPVCLVTGPTGADKRDFIRALIAARPAAQRWAVLDNDGGDIARGSAAAQLTVAAINGCVCCTGTVELRIGIAQLVRQSRPQRLIIAAAGAAEPAALERALAQEDLARGIIVSLRLCVTAPQLLTALPPSARDLLQRQMAASDHVVASNAAAAAVLHAAGIPRVIQVEDALQLVLASVNHRFTNEG